MSENKRPVEEMETESEAKLPQKKFYRQRAHSNPIADHCFDYPVSPDKVCFGHLLIGFISNRNTLSMIGVNCIQIILIVE